MHSAGTASQHPVRRSELFRSVPAASLRPGPEVTPRPISVASFPADVDDLPQDMRTLRSRGPMQPPAGNQVTDAHGRTPLAEGAASPRRRLSAVPPAAPLNLADGKAHRTRSCRRSVRPHSETACFPRSRIAATGVCNRLISPLPGLVCVGGCRREPHSWMRVGTASRPKTPEGCAHPKIMPRTSITREGHRRKPRTSAPGHPRDPG